MSSTSLTSKDLRIGHLNGGRQRKFPSADNNFIRRISALDHRYKPKVDESLEDKWVIENSDDTRESIPKGGEQFCSPLLCFA
ncbi:uncharacterized protein LY79DRAFT_159171 [Colletotrichum navitas]|uniref:Uncharacterized protein n=1 Tax=Colletotrichum navitas TaxID=681940 RepID=A0AAD8PJ15_9PEZI|nr:uncharacterized protein LY79DRAFT_159171 [Colletotrichum navitas]KAK1564134.1 hypothetical protein LY79DRAFT_159171 [Colletotrichum navitas]